VTDSPGIQNLRQLVTRRRRLNADIDAATEAVLRDGEFVDDVADVLGISRETLRHFRDDHGIPDAREIRRAKGLPPRRKGER
jgi:hypothetical protein